MENNDGPAKFAMRLSHIWGGDQMFRLADGTRNEELRVRSRLWMSVVYDTLWWSQDGDACLHRAGCPHDVGVQGGSEFFSSFWCYVNGIHADNDDVGNNDPARDSAAQRQSTATPAALPFAYNSVFDGEMPFDLGWALSDDVFFASAGWNV